MQNFNFQNSTKIIFGKNTEDLVGEEIKKTMVKKSCFVMGATVLKKQVYIIK